jgi:lactoylglutathione lyase
MNFLFNTIEVSDIDKSYQFYTEIIELKLSRRFKPSEDVEIIFLEDKKGSSVELIEYKNQESYEKNNKSKIKMGFGVDNLDKTINFLKEKDIEIKEGPVQIKDGRFVNIKDPDGVMIGLYEFK